jgi:hypothetical protein
MAQRMKAHRLRCKRPECGRMFEAWRKSQRFCSNSCGIKARGPEWFAAHQAKITAIRKANGYSRFIQRMRAAGLTDAQIAVVRKEMLMVRANAHTAGKRLGWQEALRETGDEARWRKRRAA